MNTRPLPHLKCLEENTCTWVVYYEFICNEISNFQFK